MPAFESVATRVRLLVGAWVHRFGGRGFPGCPRGLRRLASREAGVTAIEYALIASLIAVAILAGVGGLGLELEALYLRVCNAVVGALGGGSC